MTAPARRYPPISDYAIIGDSRACALVSIDGSIDWLCLPRFDSPSLFGRMLDWDKGGYFQIRPDVMYAAKRRYIDETNVLETTFETAEGSVRLIDFMPAQRERVKRATLAPLRMVVRIVEGLAGRVPMRIDYEPRPDYGRGRARLTTQTAFEVTAARRRHVTHLRTDVPVHLLDGAACGTFEVTAGRRLRFALAYSFGEPAVIVSDGYVDAMFEQSVAFWRGWSSQCTYDGAYRDEVIRSALALKLLAYAPSGAIAAAATTSLPESIGGERNWDYRYCWIRDAAMTVKAFLSIGLEAEANAFVGWLMHATSRTAPRLDPLYTLHGETHIKEHDLPHLEGYRGSRPVRIGNAASEQQQFDVYGELIEAIHRFIEDQDKPVARDEGAFIARIADHVADNWRLPDNGIWEARVEPLHYTHSKAMAWDALAHAARLVEEGRIKGDAARWRACADELREYVLAHAWNREAGAFMQTLDGTRLDSAVLMMPLSGFIDPTDPRMISTIDVLRERLERDGFLLRYSTFDDGLPPGEGAFLACNFWLSAALAMCGRIDEAHEVFRRTTDAMNDVGLMAEEYDPRTGEMLGNFPQGLSHLNLIGAALAITSAERGEGPKKAPWSPPK